MKRHRPIILFVLLLAALPLLGLRCKPQVTAQPVKLTYWRVFDDPDSMQEIISAYRAIHPNVNIEYKKIRYEEYEKLFLEALAEDRGPDIFSIHNTWIGKYQPKILPLPKTVTLPFQSIQGTFKKEVITELKTMPTITPATIRKNYLDVVASDVIRKAKTEDNKIEEQVLGLPLSVDTLVLFYNKDILNAAGIATEPKDWTEFLRDVTKITKFDEQGNIAVAGASLGTSNNIPRFNDILSILMMQNGATMTDANGFATFHLVPPGSTDKTYRPGIEALRFYTDFASLNKEAYTWNASMPDALEAFTTGKTGFFFGYAYHIPTIKSRAPQLRWAIVPLPQADAERNRMNIANYWVETVSKKTKHTDEAWDFIQFAASAARVESYLNKTNKPTALRALVEKQQSIPELEAFAGQLLTAKSWYRGRDAGLMESAMADMVTGALAATEPGKLEQAVNLAIQRINQTIY
ncbi:hypothetical protein A3H10_03015 [Candidatus Uhrbacteria bacterium RIFCSPLOWO2_12_FULL_46_10]|uniref:ABC transporter substrate-binding protein n=1 Tax=Candidatus Uhrbacteria bacterium RIFCSPLOWO2_01_FULL_47_25 TaxID=1802402 RepID=A0A1F7UXR2_9BACT|nr:MAG: Extracellular solute-binding protein family 1 [Parcubacteria group bacterium GW2011_GWA2_46_9]OGL59751.1 MAG: hypothetical protein A2752_03120 [Candidatus Uhrbacteria bacterium RIFCSPHIGHO2_01_FULL_46_23]OGL70547.1 MAG: hypothetical protein A3D60_03690 [Candidatus Uhrbacteria bacterium RIFCSPHIGHO2_02_FULL_47_29]OGL75803.1 MAG: hypothetical protein A3E96_02630 [Candidatus Uhrbacteria bacterium RIFCSPHIGHO2_12_FULL_46_13]OGL83080.1 MAG: hypothetical protein A2936_05195 [Candidatus Uhrbac